MPLTHVNAYEVFPPEIVEEIQKYYSGGYLWIPKPNGNNIEEPSLTKSLSGKSVEHLNKLGRRF